MEPLTTDTAAGVAIFRADAVYSRDVLTQMLGGIVEVDRFLRRLSIPVRFKNCVLGADILRALESPPEGSVLGQREAESVPVLRTGKPGRPRKRIADQAFAPITKEELLTGTRR